MFVNGTTSFLKLEQLDFRKSQKVSARLDEVLIVLKKIFVRAGQFDPPLCIIGLIVLKILTKKTLVTI